MNPKVSIITVTYNAEKYLEKTIISIIEQTYDNIEFLIIDGKSKDNTLEIANKYKQHIDLLVSEPDKGLYDAMNKGQQLATGDFIIFINAGDLFTSSDTVSNCFKKYSTDTDVLYGDTLMIDEAGKALGLRSQITTRKLPQQLHWKSLQLGMVVCHQSIFVRKSIAPSYLTHNLSADIDWVIGSLKKSRKTVHTGEVVSQFLLGGISNQQHWQSLKDRFKVLLKHYGLFSTLLSHFNILIRALRFQLKG
jgi:glycosyltransferase involved in cell wall biosynthesis